MAYIKVEFEYDFGGSFGGNNNQDVFEISNDLDNNQITEKICSHLEGICGLSEEDVLELMNWEYLDIGQL